ncbi:MAG: SagB/ThcOx family dehydrogenase [Bacteroidota bacterium]
MLPARRPHSQANEFTATERSTSTSQPPPKSTIMLNLREVYREADTSPFGADNVTDSLAMLYHENSKFNRFSQRRLGEKINAFYSPYLTQRSSQPYKCYPNAKRIDLTPYRAIKPTAARYYDLLAGRTSVRDYDPNYQISLPELTVLLHQAYGVTRKAKIETEGVDGHVGFRNIPSPGGLYPLEVYVVCLRSQNDPGLYHFRPDECSLEILETGDHMEDLRRMIYAEPYINLPNSGVVVITTGIIERMSIKYGERGYRFMLHESGFLAMTMSLIAESLGLGSCMVGGYRDDEINQFLDVDGVFETVQNILIIGKKPACQL